MKLFFHFDVKFNIHFFSCGKVSKNKMQKVVRICKFALRVDGIFWKVRRYEEPDTDTSKKSFRRFKLNFSESKWLRILNCGISMGKNEQCINRDVLLIPKKNYVKRIWQNNTSNNLQSNTQNKKTDWNNNNQINDDNDL